MRRSMTSYMTSGIYQEHSKEINADPVLVNGEAYEGSRIMSEHRKIHSCNCKTGCLKLYCECFRNKTFCGKNCNCTGCSNSVDKKKNVEMVRKTYMIKNPNAFVPKAPKPTSCACRTNRYELTIMIIN